MLQEPIRVYHAQATGSSVELAKAAKGKYRQKGSETTQEPGGADRQADPHDQAQGSCARCCPGCSPPPASAVCWEAVSELSLSSGGCRRWTQRWPAESAPVPSIAVRSRGLSICFSCLWASEHQLIQYQSVWVPSHQEKVLNRPYSEGADRNTETWQLGLEQPPKRQPF